MLSPLRLVVRLYRLWLAGVAGYLIGSILTADLASRVANLGNDDAVDLRATGSGNPGAGNAFANLGKGWGAAVLVGDLLKGGAGAQAGRMIAGDGGAYFAGTASVIGHCFPAWTEFRGGKGVATSAGTTLVCFPAFIPLEVAGVLGSFAATKSAGKTTAIVCGLFVISAYTWRRFGWRNAWGPTPTSALPLYVLATSGLMAYKFLTAPKHMGDRPK